MLGISILNSCVSFDGLTTELSELDELEELEELEELSELYDFVLVGVFISGLSALTAE